MCTSLLVWKHLGICAHGLRLSVCCSHQPIRKSPLYCWWALQAGWKVRRISTLLFQIWIVQSFVVVLGVIIVHQFRIEGIEYHVPQEISWVTRPPFSTLDITLIDFGLWVDARKFLYFLCLPQPCDYGVFGVHTRRSSRSLVNLSKDSTLILFL